MYARRVTLGIALLITAVMIVSSLGLLGLVGTPTAQTAPPAPLTAAATAAGSASPTTLSSGTATPIAHIDAQSTPLSQPTVPSTSDVSTPAAQDILNTLSEKGVPLHDVFLPYLMNGPDPALTSGHVTPSYTSSPAPYGIGDLGLENVSGVITPYTLSTPSVEANFSTAGLSGYSADISAPDAWAVQLNAVLNNVTLFGTGGYQFWTQNVIEYSPSLGTITFVSNIWNFSAYRAPFPCNVFYADTGTCVAPEYYYEVSEPLPTTIPFSVQLYLNSALEGGRDAVYFNYSLTQTSGTTTGTYSDAIFNSLAAGGNPASTVAPAFVANGSAYDPYGLPDDFEVMLGGPGGGSNFDVFLSKYTYMSLAYWNTARNGYFTVPSAFNTGSDTGETSVGVNAAWSSFTSEGGSPPSEVPSSCLACVTLSNGPSFQYGLWGVLGNGVGGYSPHVETDWYDQTHYLFVLEPSNAFLFFADSKVFTTWASTNFSSFQWTPDFDEASDFISLPVGNYTIVILMANYDPMETALTIVSNFAVYSGEFAENFDPGNGVYTPLWAFNGTGVANISSGVDGFGLDTPYNDEYANIGQIPFQTTYFSATPYFPWFGLVNDFGFPVFPGILLYDVAFVDIINAAAFTVALPGAPSYDQQVANDLGWPATNNLQIFVWGGYVIELDESTVGGWWPAESYFGDSQSFANVVYWNTTYSSVFDDQFNTGGMALFLYGGSNNLVVSNIFTTGGPLPSANPYATVAEYYGAIGLIEADWGDADGYGSAANDLCDVCDVVYNNAFNTLVTAESPFLDPYTGNVPNQYPYEFSAAWNVQYTPGETNIIGGNYLGGNYWWDYGSANNPYGYLPDVELSYVASVESDYQVPFTSICVSEFGTCTQGAGDYYPLVNQPLYNITFEEQGLPAGAGWEVTLNVPPLYYDFEEEEEFNSSVAPGTFNFTETAGIWYFYPSTTDPNFASTVGSATLTNQSIVVLVQFAAAYTVSFIESGLPSGSGWAVDLYVDGEITNENDSTTSTNLVAGVSPGVYEYAYYAYSSSNGKDYAPTGGDVYITVTANATVHVGFALAYVLTVHAVGVPAGVVWFFSASGGAGAQFGSTTTSDWVNFTVAAQTYSWESGAAGFVASPSSGTFALTGNSTLTVTFTSAATATGTLTGTITPAAATLWVDGTQETLGAGGSYDLTLPVGITSVEVKDAGYATYFNNVTVSLDHATTLNVALTPVTSSSSSSSAAGISNLGWLLIAVLAAAAAILLVTTLIFAGRGRTPPPVAPYNAPPPAGAVAGSPPAGAAAPPWQESPPPPGGG
jgi:thermopsin